MKRLLGSLGNLQPLVVLISLCLVSSSCSLKLGETCGSDDQCDAGLRCETCQANGNTRPRCTRIQPTNPTSKVKGLAFNRYSWLTTHNSYALSGATSATGSFIISPTNQEDNVTSQLNNGVRGFMLDMYDFENDIWLCHSTGGQCYNFTSFEPAINVLKEMESFMEANPSEIVTIFIEDYVTSSNGLTKVFNASGLSKYLFPLSRMPKNGSDWPTVDDMVQQNQRLLVFTSKSSKEASEGIAYQWNYVVENQYGDDGMKAGSCPNRAESSGMDTKSKSLVLVNYFPTDPNANESKKEMELTARELSLEVNGEECSQARSSSEAVAMLEAHVGVGNTVYNSDCKDVSWARREANEPAHCLAKTAERYCLKGN